MTNDANVSITCLWLDHASKLARANAFTFRRTFCVYQTTHAYEVRLAKQALSPSEARAGWLEVYRVTPAEAVAHQRARS